MLIFDLSYDIKEFFSNNFETKDKSNASSYLIILAVFYDRSQRIVKIVLESI